VPWPVVVAGAVVVVYASAMALTALLARLPGARATVGRARVPWCKFRCPGGGDRRRWSSEERAPAELAAHESLARGAERVGVARPPAESGVSLVVIDASE